MIKNNTLYNYYYDSSFTYEAVVVEDLRVLNLLFRFSYSSFSYFDFSAKYVKLLNISSETAFCLSIFSWTRLECFFNNRIEFFMLSFSEKNYLTYSFV